MPSNDELDLSFLDENDSSTGGFGDDDMFSESDQTPSHPQQPAQQAPQQLDLDLGDMGGDLDDGTQSYDDDDPLAFGMDDYDDQPAQQPAAPAPAPVSSPRGQSRPQPVTQPVAQPAQPASTGYDDFAYAQQPAQQSFNPAPPVQQPVAAPAPQPAQQPQQQMFPSAPKQAKSFMPAPVDVDLIRKIIAILDDYRHLEKEYQNTIKGFMSSLGKVSQSMTEAEVIRAVIDIDPGIRDAVHHFIEAKKLSGSDRAFYLMDLSALQLRNLYNVFKMSAENLDGFDFKSGFHASNDTLPEIKSAALWLNNSIEAYPDAVMAYMIPLDAVLQDAKETMAS